MAIKVLPHSGEGKVHVCRASIMDQQPDSSMGHKGQLGEKREREKLKKVHSQIQQEYEFCFIFFLLFHLSNTPAQKWKDRVVYGRIWLLLLHCIEFCTIFFFFFHHAYICNLPHPCQRSMRRAWLLNSDYITFLISCTQHSAPRGAPPSSCSRKWSIVFQKKKQSLGQCANSIFF